MPEYKYITKTDEEGEHHIGVRTTRSQVVTQTLTHRKDGTWWRTRRVQKLNKTYGEITQPPAVQLEPDSPEDAEILARQFLSELRSPAENGWSRAGGWH